MRIDSFFIKHKLVLQQSISVCQYNLVHSITQQTFIELKYDIVAQQIIDHCEISIVLD